MRYSGARLHCHIVQNIYTMLWGAEYVGVSFDMQRLYDEE